MEGVSQCMNVDHLDKKSAVVDDHDSKVKDNEESYSDSFLSTQKVREPMKDIFDTPSYPTSVQIRLM
ncbi:hypothetical protein Tco_1067252 [Tanacetum coccineum]|uniref:Uncharacterized protein n=1 Tax=Tanacetum coccineum TaxID=301880 RepID=A0ABQ5HCC6_9ASTR